MKKLILIIGLLLVIMSCTNRVTQYPVSTIAVVPVNYLFKLKNNGNSNKKSQELAQEISRYLTENKTLLLDNKLTISWRGKQGEKLAKQAKHWLLSQGINHKNLHIDEFTATAKETALLTIAIQSFKVQTSQCKQSKMRSLGTVAVNCAVESTRWQSIVHPERSLLMPVKSSKE